MEYYVVIQIKPEQFLTGTNWKFHARSAWPFKTLRRFILNAYVIDLALNFGINSTFNIEDLVAYQKPHPISNYPFKMPPKLSLDDLIETFISFNLDLSTKG